MAQRLLYNESNLRYPLLQHKSGADTEVASAGHWKENTQTTTPRLFLILSEWVRAVAPLGRLADLSIGKKKDKYD